MSQETIVLIIYTIAVIFGLLLFVILFFISFQNRKNKLLVKQIESEKRYERELATSQLEIQEQTFKNIGWELHDNVGQLLSVLSIQLNMMLLKNPDEIVILPLFPHYAAATTGSVFKEVTSCLSDKWVVPKITFINQFYDNAKFIEAWLEKAREFDMSSYNKIIFSYHGVPNSHVDNVYPDSMCSDNDCETKITNDNKFCYKATVYETTKILASKLGLEPNQYIVTFQSRLTNKWLSPFTDDVLQNLPKNGSKKVLVFSPAFTADCLETIIEIGDEYKELFYEAGGDTLDYVPSLNYSDKWVDAIVDISNINEDKDVQE